MNKLRVSYSTSLSSEITNLFATIGDQDYGNSKTITIDNLPEATLLAKVVTFDTKGDSSNTVESSSRIYGDRYISSLYNRIIQNITIVTGTRQINLLNESGKPQDSTVFYTLQRTILTYPKLTGGTGTTTVSPYVNTIPIPDLATSGIISHYSVFKPLDRAIDEFSSATTSFNY